MMALICNSRSPSRWFLPAGSMVLVPPQSTREAFATERDTAVLAVGGAPGTPFSVSPWETRQLALSRRRG